MKTQIRLLWNVILFAALATVGFRSQAQTQNFSWTVTGTGTETWYTTVYQSVTASTATAKGTEGIPTQEKDYTAGMTGQANYSYSIGISSWWWANGSDGPADVEVAIDVGSSAIFQDSTDVPQASRGSSGSFGVSAGTTYRLLSSTYDPFGQGGWAWVTVNFPSGQQPHTATQTGTATGNNFVSPSDGQKNLYGFSSSATPQPQNGGTMSGVSYSLTWNNANVALVFSDTWTTKTANPNAYIIAIWVPSVQGLSVAQTNLNSIVFGLSPGLSSNYSIGGYCVGDGVTNSFGTGPGPTGFAAQSLKPNTRYTFYISEWDWVNGVGGPVFVTNVTTLPEPSVQGLSVVQTNLNSIVFGLSPGLSTNFSIGGYCVGNGLTNSFGTGPGPTGFAAQSLKPNTCYTFYISEWDWVNDAGGPVLITNVTTLPEPSVQGLSVVQTNLSSIVFGLSPGLSTNYSIGGYCVGNGITNTFGTATGATGFAAESLQPNTRYTFYISEWDWINDAGGPVLITNVATLPVPVPVIISLTPGLSNALMICTNVLPGGVVGWTIMTNGVSIPSLTGGTGTNPFTSASMPFSFVIGNGAVPGVGCLMPGRVYQVMLHGGINGYYSGYITNSFTTLEPPGYQFLSGQLLTNGKMRLSFVGNAGKDYALEQSYSLCPAHWIPLTTNPADSLGMLTLTNALNVTSNSFWRIRAVQ